MHSHPPVAPCYPPKRRIRAPPPSHRQDIAGPSDARAPRKLSDYSSRWICPLPFCARSYARPHDLVRHLDAAHHPQLRDADDALLAVLGVPVDHIARLRTLMARRNRCAVCGATFARRDTLGRHLDEQGHRLLPAAASGTSAPPASPRPPVTPVPLGFSALPAAASADCVSSNHSLLVEAESHGPEAGALAVGPYPPLPIMPVPAYGNMTLAAEPQVVDGESFAWNPEFLRMFDDALADLSQ